MRFDTIIRSVKAKEVYSDRMKSGLFVEVVTSSGAVGQATWSAGLSVGSHEKRALYDGEGRFSGYGQQKAAAFINEKIAPALIGMNSIYQESIDTVIKSFDAPVNVSSPLSMAVLKACSNTLNLPLFQHIGGVRAITMPAPAALIATGSNRYGFEGSVGYKPSYSLLAYDFDSYSEACVALWDTYMNWYDIMKDKLAIKMQPIAGMAIPKGKLKNDYELWSLMNEVIKNSGFEGRIGLQVDMAASCFYNKKDKTYDGLFSEEGKNRDELMSIINKMAKEYNFVSIEDPLIDEDVEGFASLVETTSIQIVADDLVGGNFQRLKSVITAKACNAVRISCGQIGTVTDMEKYALYASERGIALCCDGERGEGLDACDIAIGLNAANVKEMGMCYSGNRLMDIEKAIGSRVRYIGKIGLKGKGRR